MDLNTTWFLLVGVLISGYAVLDGFDLGVGILHLFAKSDAERDVHVGAIGPVWDGNEVWLLTGGGALFAAFPVVYATIFSGYYLALMLLLVALILRAVAMEFRHNVEAPAWRRAFDWAFGVGSLLPAILFGVAVGNVLRGVPLTPEHEWAGSFLGLLNPYAVLIGLVSLAMFVMHGALYLRMKSEGALHERMGKVAVGAWIAFLAVYALATVATFFVSPFLFEKATSNPAFWGLLLLLAGGLATIPRATRAGRSGTAFLASSVVIVSAIFLAAVSLFPRLVPSLGGLENSLDIYNSASSPKTQGVMLVIALLGMPLVLAYTAAVYRIFRGKVRPGHAYGEEPSAAERAGARAAR
ncbi:cytochrome d ubiquinol oxidase subunit II [Anaeromyxobacter paludicola]|uniref:Cytochrome D oxidase subunit I n=1 Tax=Anaeromyxobacter paludicola TaxID=2918171 RepID=A0ABM7XEM6_9BACT|nr:cytochrome d ubiquinol oxidase subunit II [Anaeromyxobacter paludicola]BDG10334.1 cytochrome D oxidase subunit I [Anaeromyxobacter paludicola]